MSGAESPWVACSTNWSSGVSPSSRIASSITGSPGAEDVTGSACCAGLAAFLARGLAVFFAVLALFLADDLAMRLTCGPPLEGCAG